MVKSLPQLGALPDQRGVVDAVRAAGPCAPAVDDGRAHDRRPQPPALLPGLLDEELGVAVERGLGDGPEGVDVGHVGPHLWVQLAEAVPLHDDARAAEVDVRRREGGGGAGGAAREEGPDGDLVVRVAVVWSSVSLSVQRAFLFPVVRCFGHFVWSWRTYGLRCLPLTRRPRAAPCSQSRP